ncbi:GNAT family N-acetyltransferase [Bacillus suaedaesalsae]|uniref:GNAT family N-acetyltransferase n=1 Tax=Bacillus suaedaesalsae TaxID=2810349 RepID=A0ABS2DHD1_9BACI|nr:GNAT family N-acetyltransferase [Bacillus suaedaesalsae]MBM6617885.1 GNAT family N-acetyltransferase [Bacillus suaedaesalsae]
MQLTFEVISENKLEVCKDLCNELMTFQKSVAHIRPEIFDNMRYETRLVPSVKNAIHNYIVVVKDGVTPIAYMYSNISSKESHSNEFATFFDLDSVKNKNVGNLAQFFIKKEYRQYGIGSKLFSMSMDWLNQFNDVEDYFIYVSNGNENALEFYKRKGFAVSHEILDGFITVLRR